MMAMYNKMENLALIFLVLSLAFNLIYVNVNRAYAVSDYGSIDLFTQKEPYSGRGLNVESDAFTFGDEVEIYALVTYHGEPLQNFQVAFYISDPMNTFQSSRSNFTDENGIATINFRIPNAYETAYGEWVVTGNVKISGLTYQDSVRFKVGWLIEITSVKTLNIGGLEQEKFALRSILQADLTVQNIALTNKTVAIALSIYDSSNTLINSTELINLEFQHGERNIRVLLSIPENALLGQATLYAGAYTAPVALGGIPYCPEVSKGFTIIKRDVAIFNVKPSSLSVNVGDIVYIDVTAGNVGSELESFNVSIYFNGTFTGMMAVLNLNSYSNTTVRFAWNTSNAVEGAYAVSAIATPVSDEFDATNNVFHDGVIQVKPVAEPTGWFFTEWFNWLLLLLLIIVIILLILWFYVRRRKKKVSTASFHSGWTAWYYRYNVKS